MIHVLLEAGKISARILKAFDGQMTRDVVVIYSFEFDRYTAENLVLHRLISRHELYDYSGLTIFPVFKVGHLFSIDQAYHTINLKQLMLQAACRCPDKD
jgi:hypothetical protein